MSRPSRRERPDLPHEEIARTAAFPKPHLRQKPEATDTTALQFRKIHPERDPEYLRWLRFQPCVAEGLTNNRTGVAHVCWSPDMRGPRFVSDPMHCQKAMSGRLKQSDRGAIPGCRHLHRESEANMDRADADYGIDRFALADEFYARFLREKGRDR